MAAKQDIIHILHVDDKPELAELTAEFLRREDDRISTDTATSASEGLQRVTDNRFDCALVKYVVGGEPFCGFLDTDGQTWPDQIATFTG